MDKRRCIACGKPFQPAPQVAQQKYCSDDACQRHRRRAWHQNKLETDPAYRDNQGRAQKAWVDRNPLYWSDYRESHPGYTDENRTRQQERNGKRKAKLIAKMDASKAKFALPTGIYRLSLLEIDGIAKMDACSLEITAHIAQCSSTKLIAKRLRDRKIDA